ncbi:hypothetical protein OK016_12995 [Vibrio chagasii]|nr:hypothetical protein [Vibrio chagasii]
MLKTFYQKVPKRLFEVMWRSPGEPMIISPEEDITLDDFHVRLHGFFYCKTRLY